MKAVRLFSSFSHVPSAMFSKAPVYKNHLPVFVIPMVTISYFSVGIWLITYEADTLELVLYRICLLYKNLSDKSKSNDLRKELFKLNGLEYE